MFQRPILNTKVILFQFASCKRQFVVPSVSFLVARKSHQMCVYAKTLPDQGSPDIARSVDDQVLF